MRGLLFHTLEGRLPRRSQGLGGYGADDGQRGRIEPLPGSHKNAHPKTAEAQAFDGRIGATVMSTYPDDIELSRSERWRACASLDAYNGRRGGSVSDMTTESPQERIACLPCWIQERIKSCPAKGQGVHSWLFKTALVLHEWFSEDEIIELLQENLSCDRPEREICEAAVNAGRYFRGEAPLAAQSPWPAVDYRTVHRIVVESPVRLKDLPALSPVDLGTEGPRTEEILDGLFPGNPLLCFGRTVQRAWTKPREEWRGRESGFQFIVPSPMTKVRGLKQDGKASGRCLDSTGPRSYLVIEFDITENGSWAPYVADWRKRGITIDDANAALLLELGTGGPPRLPLVLAVHSGGKSVHGWFKCEGFADEQLRPFMARAVMLGADRATWTKCQFVRMPDGTRDNGKRQQVHYFTHGVVRTEGGSR
jgi:hypothetical protein